MGAVWGAGALPLQKNQRRFTSTLAFIASHEACCRMAVFAMQVTGIHTRPASRGTRRATAVTPQPSCMSLYAPARIARSPGGRGTAPAPRTAPYGRRGTERHAAWLRSYRRGTTGATARRSDVDSCCWHSKDRHSATGLMARNKGQRGYDLTLAF